METKGDCNKLHICDHASTCHDGNCPRRLPHSHFIDYDWPLPCQVAGGVTVKCVPWPAPAAVAESKPNHAAMRSRLRSELEDLDIKGVRSIDPVLVLRFMDYIEQAEAVK